MSDELLSQWWRVANELLENDSEYLKSTDECRRRKKIDGRMGLNWVEYVFEKRRGRERAKGLGTPI
eukprot:scaffold2585_cov407-Chaetoceros_neogracile.AAC.9